MCMFHSIGLPLHSSKWLRSRAQSFAKAKVLILDEATSSLDADEVQVLFREIRKTVRTLAWGLSILHTG